MTYSESDHIWSANMAADLEQKMLLQIVEIFIQEHENARALSKHVSKKTGLPPDTIKKWKNGRNPPRLGHFLLLLKHYPDVLKFLVELVAHSNGAEKEKTAPTSSLAEALPVGAADPEIYSAEYCTINLSLPLRIANELNQRQLWFLGLLQQGERRKAEHIASTWQVSHRMAMYDVETLIKQGLIRFRGAKKNGWYEAV